MKLIFSYLGFAVAVVNLLWFAQKLARGKAAPQNIASWALFFSLDALLTGATYLAGKPIGLPLGYSIGAGSIMICLFFRGGWSWGWRETLCAVCVAISATIWFAKGAEAGVFYGSVAMVIAGMPLLLDMRKKPDRSTWPIWVFTVVASVLTILGSDFSLTATALSWASIINNALMSWYVLKPRTKEPVVVLAEVNK